MYSYEVWLGKNCLHEKSGYDTYEDAREEALQYMKGININMLSRGMVQCEDTENYVHSLSFYLNIKEE